MNAVEEFERQHVRPKAGRTLIVGSKLYLNKPDRRKRYAEAVGVDMQDGPGVDVVADLEMEPCLGTFFTHIECMSVLEHSQRPWLMAATLQYLLEPNGTIFVTVPYVWKYHGYPHDYWRFTLDGVRALFPQIEWQAQAYAHGNLLTYAPDVPAVRVDDWPHMPVTECCLFGVRQ